MESDLGKWLLECCGKDPGRKESKIALKLDVMKELLTTQGIPLRKREYDQFEAFALDKSGELIYYEDYVTKLIEENERHREMLLKDFENFTPKN